MYCHQYRIMLPELGVVDVLNVVVLQTQDLQLAGIGQKATMGIASQQSPKDIVVQVEGLQTGQVSQEVEGDVATLVARHVQIRQRGQRRHSARVRLPVKRRRKR